MSNDDKIPFSSKGKHKQNPKDSDKQNDLKSKRFQYNSRVDTGSESRKRQIRSQIPRFRSQISRKQDQQSGDDS